MSIDSRIYADYANEMRNEWLSKLEDAHATKDWEAVRYLIFDMSSFYFVSKFLKGAS